ncbi:glycosyltransferase family 4 protein [Paenibacillus glucanolyticus]|uniref:glycosyltransferase family 4 protein n=1 Tax=Paenibacillus glucanolyticus TaxID=59843 RepID=UPI0030C9FA88
MKVLFMFYNPSGGMETLNRIRSKALIAHGVESHLLYTFDGEGRNNIKNITTFVTCEKETIREIIKREGYDAITVCSDINMLAQLRSFGYSGRLIFELQGLGRHEERLLLTQSFKDQIYEHADAILYPYNQQLRELMSSNYPEIPQYSFDDPLDWEYFGYTAYPRKPFPILGWVGRLQSNKNWRDFLLLGQTLIGLYPDLYLWLFEDETMADPAELEDFNEILANNPTLKARLIRYSNVPHDLMADYLSIIGDSGGFLLSTSISEGFGYAVAEAMLCRCPVLSTDSGGVRRFITHNKTGKFYTQGRIEEATLEAISLLTNKNEREQLIVNAEAHIKRHFSSSVYANRFSTMLNHLDQGRRVNRNRLR